LANKALVGRPVLSLIDEAAEKVGFDPVHPPQPAEPEKKPPATNPGTDLDLEEQSPSIA
jgi:hypothetical protein